MVAEASMPESFATKEEMYAYIFSNLKEHLEALDDTHKKFDADLKRTTALANASALIYYAMNSYAVNDDATTAPAGPLLHKAIVNWVGFYLLADAQYMVLGPFQGKVACTRIKVGKGVCGTAVLLGKTQCVPNVHEFPGHIACDSGSESEIVVPIRDNAGRIVGVLDIDSTVLSRFDQTDVMRLTDIAVLLSQHVTFPNVCEQRGRNLSGPLDGRGATCTVWQQHGVVAGLTTATTTETATVAPFGATRIPAAHISATVVPSAATAAPIRNPVVAAVPIAAPSSVAAAAATPAVASTATVVKKSLGDWQVECRRLDRIICAAEINRWETEHKIACIPEIVFPANAIELSFTNAKTGVVTSLTVDAESYFKNATAFYQTRAANLSSGAAIDVTGTPDEAYDTLLEQQSFLKIPVAESWKNTKFGTFDPNIDWASRGNYICDIKQRRDGDGDAAEAPRFVPSSTAAVNYDMLRRRDLEILAYDAFDLFEDDLHDTGISKGSVKMRVMPLCIFVLIRHVVRIDNAAAVARDVRLYVELDPVSGAACISGRTPAAPRVVAEVSYKHVVFPEAPIGVAPGTPQQQTRQVEAQCKAHLRLPLDELVERHMAPLLPPRNYVLEL